MPGHKLIEEFQVPNPKGHVIVVHGLNLNPLKMYDLVRMFNAKGFSAYNISLKGHRGDGDYLQDFQYGDWVEEVKQVLGSFKDKSEPLFLCAYSLGALSFLYTVETEFEKNPFEKVILLAPAISLKWFLKLVKNLPKLPWEFKLPSKSKTDYGADPRGTKLSLLYGTLNMSKELNQLNDWSKLNIPTLCVLSEQDEVISAKGVYNLTQKRALNRWQIHYLDRSSKPHFQFFHVFVSRESMGPKNWEKFEQKVFNFL